MKKIFLFLMCLVITIPTLSFDFGKDIKFDGKIRLRGYNIRNVWNFNNSNDADHWSVFRSYVSIGAKVNVEENISAYIKLANQHWSEENAAGENRDNNVFIDNAYFDVQKFFGYPVSVRIGRQNLLYGSGFVLFDGQSQTGSTSMYFDGIKISWSISDNNSLDFLYFKDRENNRDNASEDDVTLAGVYFIGKKSILFNSKTELYILNKTAEDTAGDANIYLYGIRMSDKLENNIDYSAELGIQTGDKSSTRDHDALGYKLDLGYTFVKNTYKPRVFLGYVSLSGDENSGTGNDNEGWDVFYGGWPQFGDLLAWIYIPVAGTYGGEASYTNLDMWTIGAQAKFFEKLSAKASYSKVRADEGSTKNIGNYYQLSLKYDYSKKLSFSMYSALLSPGKGVKTINASNGSDDATEVFWEAELKF